MKIIVEDFWVGRYTCSMEAIVVVNEDMHAQPDQDSRFRLSLAGDWYTGAGYEFTWESAELVNFDAKSMGSVCLDSDTHDAITEALRPLLTAKLEEMRNDY